MTAPCATGCPFLACGPARHAARERTHGRGRETMEEVGHKSTPGCAGNAPEGLTTRHISKVLARRQARMATSKIHPVRPVVVDVRG